MPKRTNRRFLLVTVAALFIFLGLAYLPVWNNWGNMDPAWLTEKEETLKCLRRNVEFPEASCLILGDSMAEHIFYRLTEGRTDKVICVTHNGSITMASYYVYCREFLESRARKEEPCCVYLVLSPFSAVASFTRPLSYLNTIAPLAEEHKLSWLDRPTIDDLQALYGNMFVREWPVLLLERFPLARYRYFSDLISKGIEMESGRDVCERWLPQIEALCRSHRAEFHLLGEPLADIKASRELLNIFYGHLRTLPVTLSTRLLSEYKSSLFFMNVEAFTDNHSHFKESLHNKAFMSSLIKTYYAQSDLPSIFEVERAPALTYRLIKE